MKAAKIIVVLSLIMGFLLPVQKVTADGASLFLSPASGTYSVGQSFVVRVFVSSSQAVNTFDVYISTNDLTVIGIDSGGSICSLYPSPPSKTATTAHFQCGLPTPGYTGSNGYIGAVTVKGNFQGVATMSIDANSSVLANNGLGTNILVNRGGASFTIQPPPTSAPSVSSPTHPNQDTWYRATTATINWSSNQGNSFSYLLDQSAGTAPDQVAEGSETTKTYDSLADGIWYFHVRVHGQNGWSATATYRLQIDSTPPEPFTPQADPKKDAEKRPIIAFTTTDATSGVDHYEIRLDEGPWSKVDNPYKVPAITSGNHVISVKAVDKAGNERIGTVDVSVKEITAPVILEPSNGSFLPYGTDLLIKGSAPANYTVKIFLDGKDIGTVKTGADGTFQLDYKNLIASGPHKIYAVTVNPDGIASAHSKEVAFTLDPKAFVIFGLTIPGLFGYGLLLLLILILIVVFIFFFLGSTHFKKKIRDVLKELEGKVESDLDEGKVKEKTKEKVEQDFEEAEEKAN